MTIEIIQGDCLEVLRGLPAESVNCCVTSPPYWGLRDYGHDGQFGLEETPEEYLEVLVNVFRQVRRVLRTDGTLWLNLGDCYAQDTKWGGTTGGKHAKGLHGTTGIGRNRTNTGLPAKNLVGIPWRAALALQADGWILRNDIVWEKPNAMCEPVGDRCTKSHEYIFLFSRSGQYHFNAKAIAEAASPESAARYKYAFSGRPEGAVVCPGDDEGQRYAPEGMREENGTRNKRTVWRVNTKAYRPAHFATFPPDLIKPCILAGCPEGGTVLDPFLGSGTAALVAQNNGCNCIGIELNPEYVKLAKRRVQQRSLLA